MYIVHGSRIFAVFRVVRQQTSDKRRGLRHHRQPSTTRLPVAHIIGLRFFTVLARPETTTRTEETKTVFGEHSEQQYDGDNDDEPLVLLYGTQSVCVVVGFINRLRVSDNAVLCGENPWFPPRRQGLCLRVTKKRPPPQLSVCSNKLHCYIITKYIFRHAPTT